jgi:putative ABC transport system permease protein
MSNGIGADSLGRRMMSGLLQDLRYGLRMLAKNPGFTVVAVITLGLGIGANTAIFSVIDATVLRPLPYREPDDLVNITLRSRRTGSSFVVPPEFLSWRSRNRSFERIESFGLGFNGYSSDANLTGAGDPLRVTVVPVTTGFFQMLGVHPILGRDFLGEDGVNGHNRVLLISAGIWRRQFGARSSVLGGAVQLDGASYTIVGVMPAGLLYPPGDAWVPLVLDATNSLPGSPDWPMLTAVGRLKRGAEVALAQPDLQLATDQTNAEFPPGRARAFAGNRVEIIPLRQLLVGNARGQLLFLLAAVGFVLLIACANLANLILGRAASRGKEISVRAALGAVRLRLIRQLLTECLWLAVAGGTFGLLLGLWSVQPLKALIPPQLPANVSLDLRVLTFIGGLSLVAVFLFGLAPAILTSRTDLSEALKEGGLRSRSPYGTHRLRGMLVVTEIALSLILLTGAGLLARSFWRLTGVEPGFDSHNVLLADIWLPVTTIADSARQAAFFHDVIERLRALPGVAAAAATTHPPLTTFNELSSGLKVSGRPEVKLDKPISVAYTSPDYFLALGIRFLSGRSFTDRDTPQAQQVAIITESIARVVFEGRDPIGEEISVAGPKGPWRTVIGVVADTKNYALDRDTWPEVFIPYTQAPSFFMTVVLRTTDKPLFSAATLQRALHTVDPNQPVSNLRSLDEMLEKSVAPRRFKAIILGIFAALAIILAAVGIYGVIAQSVTERTHEIGVRLALGDREADIQRLILGRGIVLTLVGLGVGMVGAFALTWCLSGLLYEVKPTDPLTFVVVSLLLLAVAVLAAYIPARRATKVDPIVAVRYE